MPTFFLPRRSLVSHSGPVVSHHSVSWGWQGRAESEKGLSSPVPDQQRSSSCFPVCSVGFPAAHLSFVCLSYGGGRLRNSQVWQVQSKVVDSGLVSQLGSSRRGSVGEFLLTCSFPSKVSSHLRAVSHYLNRISKLEHRCSQPLHWISYRMVWFSTGLLGATRSRLQRMPWVSTSQPGIMRHHSQGTTSTLTLSQL